LESAESASKVRIVLAGAGHCHAEILRQGRIFTSRGYAVTVISPDSDHVYSGMAPGLLAGSWTLREASLPVAELARRADVEFIQDRVTGLDPVGKKIHCSWHEPVPYEVLSINLGSETPSLPGNPEGTWPAKPVRSLAGASLVLRERLFPGDGQTRVHQETPITVAVIGGGFGGVELAANAASFLGDRGSVTIYTRRLAPSLAGSPRRMRYLLRTLKKLRVRVVEGVSVDVSTITAEVKLIATGIAPPGVLRRFNLPLAPDGALPVDRFLRVSGEDDLFAVGDCAAFLPEPLERVGVFAVRQQPVLLHNLLVRAEAHLSGNGRSKSGELQQFTDTGPYLQGMNLGPGRGLLYRGRWTVTGLPAWYLKALIDRRFIRRYTVDARGVDAHGVDAHG
jgi:NADH dehydrogenase FAD-containing subunit